jgi:hypothetical protein
MNKIAGYEAHPIGANFKFVFTIYIFISAQQSAKGCPLCLNKLNIQ